MKRIALLALVVLAAVVAGCGGTTSTANLGSDDVAVAGSKSVTKEQFQTLLARARKGYEASKRPFPKPGTTQYEQLKGSAVAFLVYRAEFEQEAEKRGVDLSDAAIDKELTRLKQQLYGNSDEKYRRELTRAGLTEEQGRLEVKASLASEGLYKKITDPVKVTQKDVQNYYATHLSQYGQPESREVRHILVQQKPLADQIYSQLKAGGNFAALAKKYSKDPGSAANGGKLTVSKGQTVPQFDKKTFELKNGELSTPVKTQYGYHIIQALSAIKPASKTPLSKVEASIRAQLEKQKKDEAMTKWVEDMRKSYCKGKINYQVGYQPNPDPCVTVTGSTTGN